MYDALAPTLGYLTRLRRRMEQVGFIPGDPLYRDVCKAHDAMHALVSWLHYLACKSGSHERTILFRLLEAPRPQAPAGMPSD